MRLPTIVRTTHPTARVAVIVTIFGLITLGLATPAQGAAPAPFEDYDKLKAIFQTGFIKNTPKPGLQTATDVTVRAWSGTFFDQFPPFTALVTGTTACVFIETSVRTMGAERRLVSDVSEDGCVLNPVVTVAADKSTASVKSVAVPLHTSKVFCDPVTDECTSTETFTRNVAVAGAWRAAPENGALFTDAFCFRGVLHETRDMPANATGTINGVALGLSSTDVESTRMEHFRDSRPC
jgi:hypothetical protein